MTPAAAEGTMTSNLAPPQPSVDRAIAIERPKVKRAQSDSGQRVENEQKAPASNEDYAMRHGWQEEYTSTEYLKILHSVSS